MIELSKKYPNLVQLIRIGKTYENRPIVVLRVNILDYFNKIN